MKTQNNVREIYARLRADPVSMLVGRQAETCLIQAKTIARFLELESDGLVRISSQYEDEIEETIDHLGCYCVRSEYLDESGEWRFADTIGMCVYKNPESHFENCYVVDLMDAAIERAESVQRM